jgi:hypothetical protein
VITEAVKPWINETDLPTLLRAISKLCREKYDQDSRAIYEQYKDSGRDFWAEDPPEERKARDKASAFMFVNLEHDADRFETNISRAGLSRDELSAIETREEIERMERTLEYKKKAALLRT